MATVDDCVEVRLCMAPSPSHVPSFMGDGILLPSPGGTEWNALCADIVIGEWVSLPVNAQPTPMVLHTGPEPVVRVLEVADPSPPTSLSSAIARLSINASRWCVTVTFARTSS